MRIHVELRIKSMKTPPNIGGINQTFTPNQLRFLTNLPLRLTNQLLISQNLLLLCNPLIGFCLRPNLLIPQ